MKVPTLLLFEGVKEEFNWLAPDICGELYDLCREKLFENADGIKFYLWLNLRAKTPLVPKPRAKAQIKYLISRLAQLINTDKDPVTHIDTSVSETFNEMTDEFCCGVIRGLDEKRKKDLLAKTWQKKAAEKCGISYADIAKHRTHFTRGIDSDKTQRSKDKKEFISNLDKIIERYAIDEN